MLLLLLLLLLLCLCQVSVASEGREGTINTFRENAFWSGFIGINQKVRHRSWCTSTVGSSQESYQTTILLAIAGRTESQTTLLSATIP